MGSRIRCVNEIATLRTRLGREKGLAMKSKFSVWKIIKIGTGLKTADDFRKDIRDKGMVISKLASNVLGMPAFTIADKEIKLRLVNVTAVELGLEGWTRRDKIYAKGKEFGLELCPSEGGPQLRSQYQDQPNGERIYPAMKPIAGPNNVLEIFSVICLGSELSLRTCYGRPDYLWSSDSRWLFVLP